MFIFALHTYLAINNLNWCMFSNHFIPYILRIIFFRKNNKKRKGNISNFNFFNKIIYIDSMN